MNEDKILKLISCVLDSDKPNTSKLDLINDLQQLRWQNVIVSVDDCKEYNLTQDMVLDVSDNHKLQVKRFG